MAMFPPAMPHTFIEWLTRPRDVVYDPFSGRGTTPLEACLMGRVGLGSDLNPLAFALTSAKVAPPQRAALVRRVRQLRSKIRAMSSRDEPEHVTMLFTARTLGQLLWLRENLDSSRATDRFILAALLGVLHANADMSGKPRGLTIAMPNTFSMSPRYVARYIRDHRLKPPAVEVFDVLERRLAGLALPDDGVFEPGAAWMQDATVYERGPVADPAKLVFTSPPYLHVILYGKFNWLRLWLLGHERKPVDEKLFTSSSLPAYLDFMTEVLQTTRARVRDDGYACFVIGDVRKGETEINLAREVARHCVASSGFRTMGIITDKLPVEHKVSRIWGENRGRATRTDRILMLAGPRSRDPGSVPAIAWQARTESADAASR